jgi:Leucine-rich repeat (LRR) protein
MENDIRTVPSRLRREWLTRFVARVAIVGLFCAAPVARAADEAEEKAVAELQKMGGKIERDMKEPAKPVIGVNLSLTQVSDEGLAQLERLPKLKRLSLNNTPITDAGLEHLKGLKELQKVYAVDTKITDAGLEHLKELKSLEVLSLVGTQVTDDGLEKLKELTELKTLFVFGTKVTEAGAKKLQEALPKLKIDR